MKAKKLLLTILLVGVLLAILTVSSFAGATGTVNGGGGSLNLRSGSGTSYQFVIAIPNGTSVKIIETVNCNDGSTNGMWHHITCVVNGAGYEGYVSSNMITDVVYEYDTTVPDEYASYVSSLKAAHPNWNFVFFDTGLNWNDVVAAQTKPKVSMIAGSRPLSYRSTTHYFTNGNITGYVAAQYLEVSGNTGTVITQSNPLKVRSGPGSSYSVLSELPKGTVVQFEGIYNTDDGTTSSNRWCKVTFGGYSYTPTEGSSWYQAHGQVVQYYLDPRNFLNEKNVFMFEQLKYNGNSQTLSGVSAILSKTAWGNSNYNITANDGRSISYAQAFYEAGQMYNVSPYHLASRAVQEVGTSGTNAAYGNNSSYPGIYNYYSIGANTGMLDGLNWASQSGSYGRPWNSPYKSIVGGAQYISEKYISGGQTTLYFQKFDLIASGGLYNHQYMSNIEAAENESVKMYNCYASVGALDSSFTFVIPVFKNFPHFVCKLPIANSNPNFAADTEPVNPHPTGVVDAINGGTNVIRVSGWCFDRDMVNESLSVHVYIGGPAGTPGAEAHIINADILRNDVNNAYGIGGKHGFDCNIYTSKTGTQDVYIYAINVGSGNVNPELGHSTVNISSESVNPVISDLSIINKTSNSYTVQFKATDNVAIKEVVHATWSIKNGQDDIVWSSDVKKDGEYYQFVITNDNHNNEVGNFITHLFVYDYSGNRAFYECPIVKFTCPRHNFDVVIDKEPNCTSEGQRTLTCKDCGDVIIEAIPATGHIPQVIPSVPPTYINDGLTQGSKCAVCGKILKEQESVPKLRFPDVDDSEWYSEPVYFCAGRGYFNGYRNGYFGPHDNIQRQDFVLVLSKIAGADLNSYAGQNGGFPDVPANDYYSQAIAWAVDNGIITGYANGRFGVGDPITREQICTIMHRYIVGNGGDTALSDDVENILANYKDKLSVSEWAVNDVAWAIENGVIKGTTPTTISPLGNANRAQIAQIIYNMSKNNLI